MLVVRAYQPPPPRELLAHSRFTRSLHTTTATTTRGFNSSVDVAVLDERGAPHTRHGPAAAAAGDGVIIVGRVISSLLHQLHHLVELLVSVNTDLRLTLVAPGGPVVGVDNQAVQVRPGYLVETEGMFLGRPPPCC